MQACISTLAQGAGVVTQGIMPRLMYYVLCPKSGFRIARFTSKLFGSCSRVPLAIKCASSLKFYAALHILKVCQTPYLLS